MAQVIADDRGPMSTLISKSSASKPAIGTCGMNNRMLSAYKNLTGAVELCGRLKMKHGGCSYTQLKTAGLDLIEEENVYRCRQCQWGRSDWTPQMDPFKMHAENSPDCPYILSFKCSGLQQPKSLTTHVATSDSFSLRLRDSSTTKPDECENRSKRQKLDASNDDLFINHWNEAKPLEQSRRRTFSHWPHRSSPTSAQMIEAGFFSCNVGDRVICIYCHLICQQWTPHGDDPCEVHKILSPNCLFVKSKLLRREPGSILIVNEATSTTSSTAEAAPADRHQTFRGQGLVHTVACHPLYAELPKRHGSFHSWPTENLPSVDDLVRAGFFYSGTKSIVTCFYCNGSLQNWGPKDNPMIEHARWFPNCAYAKQLCGEDLYRKIQESKRAQQERIKAEEIKKNNDASSTSGTAAQSLKLVIPDESTLSRLVAARLDLPISQSLLAENFKLSIIKRCWEDQLRLKHDDFVSDCDLRMACVILQKQIEYIDGKKENIMIPSVKLKQLRDNAERERAEAAARVQTGSGAGNGASAPSPSSQPSDTAANSMKTLTAAQSESNESSPPMAAAPGPSTNQPEAKQQSNPDTSTNKTEKQSAPSGELNNPCVVCMQEEKGLACIPCGHLVTCVPCGHSLRSCPLCRREIEAFVRVYV